MSLYGDEMFNSWDCLFLCQGLCGESELRTRCWRGRAFGGAGEGHMCDINRVSERIGGSGPKAKSGEMRIGTVSTAEVGWGAGVQVSSILLWLGSRRIGSTSGKGL